MTKLLVLNDHLRWICILSRLVPKEKEAPDNRHGDEAGENYREGYIKVMLLLF